MRLAAIARYPIKGLTAEALQAVEVCPERGLPGDRAFAVVHGRSLFDPSAPAWMPRKNFLNVRHIPRLNRILAELDPVTERVRVRVGNSSRTHDLCSAEGVAGFLDVLAAEIEDDGLLPLKLARPVDTPFTDTQGPLLSLTSFASLAALEHAVGGHVDPARFRSNLWLEEAPAFAEAGWPGRSLRIGTVRFEVVSQIKRCLAVEANASGTRDLPVLLRLFELCGAPHFGVLLRPLNAGLIECGDHLELAL